MSTSSSRVGPAAPARRAARSSGQRRVLHDRDLTGELGEQPDGPRHDVVEVDRAVQERLDGPALGRRQRLDRGQPVDEQPVALVGGHPPGAGVRLGDVALVLQHRHVVADRRRRDAQVVPLDQRLGARPAPGSPRSPRRSRGARRACGPRARAPPLAGGRPLLALTTAECQCTPNRADWRGPRVSGGRDRPAADRPAPWTATPVMSSPAGAAADAADARVAAERGLVVEDARPASAAPWCAPRSAGGLTVVLEDRHGRRRGSRSGRVPAGGPPVRLVRPAQPAAPAAPGVRQRVGGGPRSAGARRPRSRIYVEGSTTRSSSRRSGATTCGSKASWSSSWAASTTWRPPSPSSAPRRDRRLGVLVDHLVAGQQGVAAGRPGRPPHVLVVGHPYVDIWQAVRPAALASRPGRRCPAAAVEGGRLRRAGLAGRPARRLAADPRRRRSYADLEPSLLGRVEELIDFVTAR